MTWLRRLFCRHRELIRVREGRKYLVACSRCGYQTELIRRVK